MLVFTWLFILMGLDIISLIIISVFLLVIGNIFKVNHNNGDRNFKRQIFVDVKQMNPIVGRCGLVSGLIILGLLLAYIALIFLHKWILAFLVVSFIPLCQFGLTVIPISYRYNHWDEKPVTSVDLVDRKRFRLIITLRIIRLLLIWLLFLTPAVTFWVVQIIIGIY